jgi:hypothetical protein
MEGYYKINRKLLDSLLWLSEPFTRGQAWVDLIGLATYEYTFFYVRGNKVELQRGQVGWSEPKLSERWKWSRTKLRKFLNDLEKEQQIIQQKNTVTQILTIVNYNLYQEKEQQSGQQKDSRSTYTIKDKKEKESIVNTILPYDSMKFSSAWTNLLKEPNWKKKSANALNISLKLLSEVDEATAIKMIEKAIECNWKGIYPVKENGKAIIEQPTSLQKAVRL